MPSITVMTPEGIWTHDDETLQCRNPESLTVDR